MLTSQLTEQLGRTRRIDNFTILREYLQLVYLKQLYQTPKSGDVYFKGGTAIHFIYHSFRFSADLDFTSILDEASTRALAQETFDRFSLETTDVELEEQETITGLKFRIKHQPQNTKQILSIRLDFSFREQPIHTDISVIKTDFPVSPYPLVSHLKADELLAEKVRALLVRGKPRDVFDIWYLLSKDIPLNQELIGRKMAIYPERDVRDIPSEILSSVNHISTAEYKQDLDQFLPDNYRNFSQQLPGLLEKQLQKFT